MIRGLVRAGVLHRLHQGVYIFGVRTIGEQGYLHGALLACGGGVTISRGIVGDGAFFSGRTTGALLRLRAFNRRAIELTVPGSGGRGRPGLIIHRARSTPPRDELRTTNGLPHSSFARMLCEVAERERPGELRRIVEAGVSRNLFDIDRVERTLDRHAHRHGIANLEEPLAYYLDRTDRRSELERMFDIGLAARPDIPPPDERNVIREAGGIRWEIDCLWHSPPVALELDGRAFHIIQRDLERDKLKDMKLAAHLGLIPVGVTYLRYCQSTDDVFDDLRALVCARRAA